MEAAEAKTLGSSLEFVGPQAQSIAYVPLSYGVVLCPVRWKQWRVSYENVRVPAEMQEQRGKDDTGSDGRDPKSNHRTGTSGLPRIRPG